MVEDYLVRLERDMATGALHAMLLGHIGHSAPIHGYGLIKAMDEATEGGLLFKPGTIYPILNEFERSGIVKSTWGAGESGPQRKYYTLTPRGKQVLILAGQRWKRIRASVDLALGGAAR